MTAINAPEANVNPSVGPSVGPSVRPPAPRPKQPVPWNVVLLDDQHHTYAYVVEMLQRLFHQTEEAAFQTATKVDTDGRAVCFTTHKELAELKRDQIHALGKDARIGGCRGSMSAVIELAQ